MFWLRLHHIIQKAHLVFNKNQTPALGWHSRCCTWRK